ncbi:MAG: alcohol dehydrogenase catalytic domain-containing protein [Caulobacteraceae bacterium]|nr:alcohol dehydrogenase catalytic domain-containing protein [Caulobacteraceae bacterium]
MTRMMRAYRQTRTGDYGELVEIPVPEPGPGQVRLKTAGAGLCQSDLILMRANPPFGPIPATIGHEATGWVDAIGPGVEGLREGDAYGMFFSWGCGRCMPCAKGEENLCAHPGTQRNFVVGWDGGLAEYFLADSPRHLVPLDDLDPVSAAPLMCAGMTAQHGVHRGLGALGPGKWAVVIGVGGVGHMAIQVLKALTPARVIACDVTEEKLEHAKALGADEAVLSGTGAAERIRSLTKGLGADVVLDVVGKDATLALGVSVLAQQGRLEVIGMSGGSTTITPMALPRDASVSLSYAGSIPELKAVIELARQGLVKPDILRIGFEEITDAYRMIEAGSLRGRAVVVPHT